MSQKKVIKITESELRRIISERIEAQTNEQDSPKTIKGFLKSTKPGERGKPTNDFVVIKLGDNMRYGNYENCVITQSNSKDSRIKSGTKGIVGKIDKQSRKCEFTFNNPSSGKIELVDIELNKSPHLY